MTRKIIEIKVTKRGEDGKPEGITFINALDSFKGTPFEVHDRILEAGIKEACRRKAEEAQESMDTKQDSIYQVSPTFCQPTVVFVGLGEELSVAATVNARGIERPFVKELITPATRKLYHHESGIVGLMDEEGGKHYKTVRLPIRMVRELGMDEFTGAYPWLGDCLEFQPPERDGVSAEIDGDLSYRESMIIDYSKETAISSFQLLTPLVMELQRRVMVVGSLDRKEYPRRKTRLRDFTMAGDVSRFYEELEHSPWDLCMGVVPYTMPLMVNGVMGRVYSDGSDSSSKRRQVLEMRIPIGLVREIRQAGKKTGIEPVDQFIGSERMDIGEEDFMMCIKELPPVQLVGDMVYRRASRGMGEYDGLRGEIDSLGMRYLNNRMRLLRVVG